MNDARTRGRGPGLAAAAAGLVAVAVHLRTLGNEPLWDDPMLVVNNPFLRSWSGVIELFRHDLWTASATREHSEFYRPLTMLAFAVDGALGGWSAAAWHAGNALLHGLVVVAIAWLASALVEGAAPWIAAACALGFGLAPEHTEPVAWISGRFDLLAALFAALALAVDARPRPLRRTIVVAVAACALLSKEAGILVPALVVLADVVVHRRALRGELPKYAALGAIVLAYLAARRAVGVISAGAAPGAIALVQSYASLLATVLRLLVVPRGLDAFHWYRPPALPAAVAIVSAAVGALGALAWTALRTPAGSRARAALFGAAWFFAALVPASVAAPTLDIAGDRYAYLPDVGLAIAAAAGAAALRDRLRSRAARAIAAAATVAVLAAWGALAWLRLADWRDERTLHEASLRADPDNPYSLYAIGELDVLAGRFAEGDALLERAIALGRHPWRALFARCVSKLRQNQLEEAQRACVDGLAINGRDPRAWVNLASIYVRAGAWDEALRCAREAMRWRGRYAEAHYLAGVALAKLRRMPDAIAELRAAVRINPAHAGARSVLEQLGVPLGDAAP